MALISVWWKPEITSSKVIGQECAK